MRRVLEVDFGGRLVGHIILRIRIVKRGRPSHCWLELDRFQGSQLYGWLRI